MKSEAEASIYTLRYLAPNNLICFTLADNPLENVTCKRMHTQDINDQQDDLDYMSRLPILEYWQDTKRPVVCISYSV